MLTQKQNKNCLPMAYDLLECAGTTENLLQMSY